MLKLKIGSYSYGPTFPYVESVNSINQGAVIQNYFDHKIKFVKKTVNFSQTHPTVNVMICSTCVCRKTYIEKS